jgi:acetoin utilization protein AcuB
MLVRDCMKTRLITVGPDTSLPEAFALLQLHSIRHLPVVEGDRLLGLVSDRNLRLKMVPSHGRGGHSYRFPRGGTVREVMVQDPLTVTPHHPVEDAAILLHDYKVGCLPVVEGDKLVGVITVVDILEIFVDLMGLIQQSTRIDLKLDGRQALSEVLKTVRACDAEVLSVSISQPESGERVYHLRLKTDEASDVAQALERRGYAVIGVY